MSSPDTRLPDDDAGAVGVGGRLGAVGASGLAQDGADVIGDGVLADEQAGTDLTVGQALANASRHLGLAWQPGRQGSVAGGSPRRRAPGHADSCRQLIGALAEIGGRRDLSRACGRLPNRRGPPPSKVVSCCARPVPARPGSGDRRRRAAGTARPNRESVGRAEADRECRHQVAAVEWKELGGEYVGAVRVAEGEAGLGEKHQAGRPIESLATAANESGLS